MVAAVEDTSALTSRIGSSGLCGLVVDLLD
jgi:hypothetical protein